MRNRPSQLGVARVVVMHRLEHEAEAEADDRFLARLKCSRAQNGPQRAHQILAAAVAGQGREWELSC